MKKLLFISFLLLSSCTNAVINSGQGKTSIARIDDNTYIAQVGTEKGADFSIKLNFQNGFSAKASSGGKAAKQPTDISKVDVYLLKLAANFSGTDPIGSSGANVVKSFTDVVKGGSSFNLTFKNVPGLSGLQYWVGVVAKDSTGAVISKPPSPAWTGGTATAATSALALSTSGIGVSPVDEGVTSTGNLTVNVPLLDASGAQIGADASVNAGSDVTNAGITVQ